MELCKAAHSHLVRYINNLEILNKAGDTNAANQIFETERNNGQRCYSAEIEVHRATS